MSGELRFDFPPEVKAERRRVYNQIDELMAERTHESAWQANRLHVAWLRRYPDDYVAWDAGEVIGRNLSCYENDDGTPTGINGSVTSGPRFDFPAELKAGRKRLFKQIDELLAEETRDAYERAKKLHSEWILAHPDDYVAIDDGIVFVILEGVYKISLDVAFCSPDVEI